MSEINSPFCKYHPTEYASWYCPYCKVHSCINCVNDPRGDLFPSCTLCRKTLTSLSLAPIQPSIKLGKILNPILQVRSLLIVFIVSLLMAGISISAWPNWLQAIALGGLLATVVGFNFSLMEKVANNEPSSVNIKSIADTINWDILVKFLIYMVLVATLLLKLISATSFVAQLVAAWLIFGIPASLVIIMMEKRFFSSFNPLKILAVVKIFSMIYFLSFILWLGIIGFLATPSLVLAPKVDSFFIQSALIYSIALLLIQFTFRLMGTAVFKNHVELNYSVRSARRSALKNTKQDSMNEVDIYVQEGRFEDATKLLWKMIDQNNRSSAYEKLISIYHFQGNSSYYQRVAQQYFVHLENTDNYQRAAEYYNHMLEKNIVFKPESVKLAVAMANEMNNPRQAKGAIVLLNQYNYEPGANAFWDKLSFRLAQLEFEFNQDQDRALELLDRILKRSLDQDILETAGSYKLLIESQ